MGPAPRAVLTTVLVVLSALSVLGLDHFSRARAAFRRAERMEELARDPDARAKAMGQDFLQGLSALDRRRLSPAEREIEVEILRKRWEEARLRSPWTDAYHAWRDVYALWAPPETAWTRRARLLAPAARQRWREEWTARRLPFEPALLDLEAGEDGALRLLYTTRDRREAAQAIDLLEAAEVPCSLIPPPAGLPPAARAARLLVPEDRFWDAHQALRRFVGLVEN